MAKMTAPTGRYGCVCMETLGRGERYVGNPATVPTRAGHGSSLDRAHKSQELTESQRVCGPEYDNWEAAETSMKVQQLLGEPNPALHLTSSSSDSD